MPDTDETRIGRQKSLLIGQAFADVYCGRYVRKDDHFGTLELHEDLELALLHKAGRIIHDGLVFYDYM